MRVTLSRLLTIGLVAGLAVIGAAGGRALWDSVIAQDEPRANPPPLDVINAEAAKPKFQGELLGMFIGPIGAKVPDKFTTYDPCGSNPGEQLAWDKAGEFDLKADLPDSLVLDTTSLNTGVIGCGDTVYAARWEYGSPQPNGYPGSLIIARSGFKYDEFDVSPDRVHTTEVGGLPAIVIDPLSENGISSVAAVIFPGDRVTTSISSEGIPRTDVMKIAELVADAIKKGE
jgi:hypothetical protein